MVSDVYEFMYYHNQRFSTDNSTRELGKNAFYSIVEIGESYDEFKSAFFNAFEPAPSNPFDFSEQFFKEDDFLFKPLE